MLAVIGGVFGKVDTEAEPEQLITKAGELDMDEVRASAQESTRRRKLRRPMARNTAPTPATTG